MVRAALGLVILVVFARRNACAAKVVLVNIRRDVPAQIGARLLIEAKMDAAIDARVADVVGDLVERRVVEREAQARRDSPC